MGRALQTIKDTKETKQRYSCWNTIERTCISGMTAAISLEDEKLYEMYSIIRELAHLNILMIEKELGFEKKASTASKRRSKAVK